MANQPFWNDERDDLLVTLWAQEPKLRLCDMVAALGGGISDTAVSNRGATLGLPSRYSSVHVRVAATPPAQRPVRRIRASRAAELRSAKKEAALEVEAAAPPRVKAPPPLETPCPFYNPLEAVDPCGVMVNRRPNALGVKKGPYCEKHEQRVLPISKGPLGTPATYAQGHRYA